MTDLYDFPGLYARTPAFIAKIVDVAGVLEVDPNWLLTIMQLESGIDPAARNPQGKATGLIQFMPSTAKALGTTVDELRSMADHEQLDYVERFYSRYAGKLRNVGGVYMVTFYPTLAFKPGDTVIARKGSAVYDQNSGLDSDKDGTLTVYDVESKAERALANYRARGNFQGSGSEAPAVVEDSGWLLGAVTVATVAGLWLVRRRQAARRGRG